MTANKYNIVISSAAKYNIVIFSGITLLYSWVKNITLLYSGYNIVISGITLLYFLFCAYLFLLICFTSPDQFGVDFAARAEINILINI